jgi:hypothetical protein
LTDRLGVGFLPAPIIASTPARAIAQTLNKLSQLRRSRVHGKEKASVTAANVNTKSIIQSPLSESVDKACCPDSSSEPVDAVANIIVLADKISRPIGPKMIASASPVRHHITFKPYCGHQDG